MLKSSLPSILCGLWLSSSSCAYENPVLMDGKNESDSLLGSFRQNNTGDCFFLASLIAIAQDINGQALIESAIYKDNKHWKVTFPNLLDQTVKVTEQDIKQYKLTNSAGLGLSPPVLGDLDIKILEIAADKLWKKIKPEGLWDDVPMNAVYMFSSAEQLIIWNRAQASTESIIDIEKYQQIPAGIVREINTSSPEQAADILKTILSTDTDGVSMTLIDYINYHATAIIDINFNSNTYSYIDTTSNTYANQNLTDLFLRLANGQYAINYLEIH